MKLEGKVRIRKLKAYETDCGYRPGAGLFQRALTDVKCYWRREHSPQEIEEMRQQHQVVGRYTGAVEGMSQILKAKADQLKAFRGRVEFTQSLLMRLEGDVAVFKEYTTVQRLALRVFRKRVQQKVSEFRQRIDEIKAGFANHGHQDPLEIDHHHASHSKN